MKVIAGTLWTLSSQIYMAVLSVVAVPLYLAVLGQSLYGLIAFFLQLQMVISLLDIGVSATVARNTALFKIGKLDRATFFSCVNSIELIFVLVGAGLLCVGFFGSDWMVHDWLDVEALDTQQIVFAIELMFFIVFIRWLQTFYRASLFGAELIVWVAKVNVFASTIRVLGVLPMLWWVSDSIVDYFWFQLAVNALELVVLFWKSQKVLAYRPDERFGSFSLADVVAAVKSSSVIGATSLVWAVLAQLDKFAASGTASLSHYTAYSLVVTAASVLVLLSAPIIYTIGPKMAKLLAEQQQEHAVHLFRNASLFVAVLLSPAFVVALLWGEQLLWMWTGDREMAAAGATYIPLYLTGTLAFALNYLSYSICFANGDFGLRLKLSLYSLAVYLPVLSAAALYSGLAGLALAWCLLNILFFVAAQPALYANLQSGLFLKSVSKDILKPLLGSFLFAVPCWLFNISSLERLEIFVFLTIVFLISLAGALLLSRAGQEMLRYKRQRGVA